MRGPARFWDEETLADIMKACIIMHVESNYRDNGYLPEMSTAEYGDFVCFTGSDSDNYNEMPLFFHNLNFFLVFGRDERVQYLSLFVFFLIEKMIEFCIQTFLIY